MMRVVTVAVLMVAVIAGVLVSSGMLNKDVKLEYGKTYPVPKPIPAFEMVSSAGAFTNESLKGKWHMVFFGYTFCPDICPATLQIMTDMYNRLPEDQQQKLQVMMLSVDPARDTPKRLNDYITYFNKDFIGVTGDEAKVSALTRALNIVYMRTENEESPENYYIDHSSAILLINPDGNVHAVFTAPHKAEEMKSDLSKLLS